MKVVNAQNMSVMESQAYSQGSSPQEFMEEAGKGIAQSTRRFIDENKLDDENVLLLCGKGNNGGDAYVAGCHLINQGYHVTAIQLENSDNASPLCRLNAMRFLNLGGKITKEYTTPLSECSVILDGLFGTGFHGAIEEPYASLIHAANESGIPILSIDIPSGLNGTTGEVQGPVIKATKTCFLGLPKSGFFLQEGWEYVGELEYVSFGLPDSFIRQAEAVFELLRIEEMSLPPIHRTWHKYQRGYVMGLAGSPGMPGAALLASLSALRGGSGMVRLLHPNGMQGELSGAPYELIRIPYSFEDAENVIENMNKATATFVGPGLGRTQETAAFLKNVVPSLLKPCVIDADALTILAETPYGLPKQVILTPHVGEMERLLPKIAPFSYTLESLKLCQRYAEEKKITLVLKGPLTFIFHPGKLIAVNTISDPGMATAGSGDVLTGLIASLLAQGLGCYEAATLGVFLHGLAGHLAAKDKTSYNILSTDIIAQFSAAYAKMIALHRLEIK